MKNQIERRLDSEKFGETGRLYFIDLMQANNRETYLQITRSDLTPQGHYERSTIVLFERDFTFFVEAVSMILHRYTYGEGGQ